MGYSKKGKVVLLFVHHTGIAGTGFKYLVEGERVTFEAYPARRGMEARNVSRI